MPDETHIKAYEEAGKYVMRELGLINNRLTWILTIHGFLYATYGLNLQKQLEITERLTETDKAFNRIAICTSLNQSQLFAFTIAIVGLFISLFGLLSISAACKAMEAISDIFTEANSDKFKMTEKFGMRYYTVGGNISFPHLLGGGVSNANRDGNRASKLIPFVLLISWLVAISGILFFGIKADRTICKTYYTGHLYEATDFSETNIIRNNSFSSKNYF